MAKPIRFTPQEKQVYKDLFLKRINRATAAKALNRSIIGIDKRFVTFKKFYKKDDILTPDFSSKDDYRISAASVLPKEDDIEQALNYKPEINLEEAPKDLETTLLSTAIIKDNLISLLCEKLMACTNDIESGNLKESQEKRIRNNMKLYASVIASVRGATSDFKDIASVKLIIAQTAQLSK